MTEIDVRLAASAKTNAVISAVEDAGTRMSLQVSIKTKLEQYPGCVHWHFKRAKMPGILEVTWWPSEEPARHPRLWLSVHKNRQAHWVVEALPQMKELIEVQLLFNGYA